MLLMEGPSELIWFGSMAHGRYWSNLNIFLQMTPFVISSRLVGSRAIRWAHLISHRHSGYVLSCRNMALYTCKVAARILSFTGTFCSPPPTTRWSERLHIESNRTINGLLYPSPRTNCFRDGNGERTEGCSQNSGRLYAKYSPSIPYQGINDKKRTRKGRNAKNCKFIYEDERATNGASLQKNNPY